MRLSLFGSNAKVLLVGEGNFSFAATLVKHNLNIALVATCYDNNIKETAKQNVEILKNHGAQVILGVDATQLENHDTLKSEHFDTVVFNFPHVGGKMRIEKNRELIKRFFISVRKVIQRNGQVLMSLCNGQGGTLADECQRTWNDSWQITEMAAHGDFIVSAVEPFDSTLFDTYTVTGYRSLEKKFNTQGSLVHILKLADEPNLENIRPVIPIDLSKSHHKIVNWNDLILELDNLGGLDKNVEKNQGFTKSYHFDITMQNFQGWKFVATICRTVINSNSPQRDILLPKRCRIVSSFMCKSFHNTHQMSKNDHVPSALRNMKPKSQKNTPQHFTDMKQVRVKGGNGGDGCISFLQLWCNDRAGPDGGDGGHGGHIVFQVSNDVKDLSTVPGILEAEQGENGANEDCFGKNAKHNVVKVPIGTIVRDTDGTILADLDENGMMYIAARGGAGGHGNAYFKSDVNQAPKVAEFGGEGESKQYVLEVRSMAHLGLIGLPNAGKSTLLRAITRARPKVAEYPFTTLKPHIGMIQYDDYEQVAVADLPGLIPDSHKNKGLGITFLKHAERCAGLMFIIDITQDEPWTHLEALEFEISQFNENLLERPKIVIANKIDLPQANDNLELMKKHVDIPIIPISAKMGLNISALLREIRILYDNHIRDSEEAESQDAV
ncbi:hypothetical protein QAD02_004640 [Eretmocerus hayati]|uniref:Uncharacterized protein n=1 Tax=Eretmocerus hayati TaxID=131215 RepID=A0ACC2NRA4_9HYME|nr:hypothetical protein QAD02_004640 [Eretmocerus hayati]